MVTATAAQPGADRPIRRAPFTAERLYLGGLFVVFSALAFLFPRSGDDWAWGSSIGTQRVDAWFKNYNGRYAGDLVIVALTRTPVLTQLITGAMLTLIVFLALDLADLRTPLGYATATALLLLMPRGIWREAIVWLSGFTNYGFATAVALTFLWWAKRDWLGRWPRERAGRRVPLVAVGAFVGALFMENVTIYLVIAAAVWVVAYRIVRGRHSLDALAWLGGLVVGAVVMFSNGAYRRAAAGTTGNYQRIQPGGGGLKADLKTLGSTVYHLALGSTLALNAAVVAVVLLLARAVARRTGWRRAVWPVGLALAFLASVALARVVWQRNSGVNTQVAVGYVSGALLVATLVTVAFLLLDDRARRAQLLVLVGSYLVVIAPMAAVHPVGPRCFFVSYVVLTVIVAGLLREASGGFEPRFTRGLAPAVAALAVGLFAWYFVVYGQITAAVERRIDHVRAAVHAGQHEVHVARLPHGGSYVHDGNPINPIWQLRFKLYYDLPSDLTLVFQQPLQRTKP